MPIESKDMTYTNNEEQKEEEGSNIESSSLASVNFSGQQQQETSNTSVTTTTERRCWICFGEDQDSDGRWVKSCPCSLVSHEQCLLDWIAENQKGRSPMKKVLCPQCSMPYYLFEQQSVSLICLEFLQSVARTAAPYLMVFGLGCSILIASTTVGIHSFYTLFGRKEGERLLGPTHSWTWRTFLGLSSIPFALIASRSRLVDGVFPFAAIVLIRASAPVVVTWPPPPALVIGSLPWIRLVYFTLYAMLRNYLATKLSLQTPASNRRSRYIRLSLYRYRGNSTNQRNHFSPNTQQQEQRDDPTNHMQLPQLSSLSTNRDAQDADLLYGRSDRDLNVTIMGALLWPTISDIIGSCLKRIRWIRYYFPDAFHRNILGGCLFVVVKDMATLLYRYKRICQRRSRRIKPFDGSSTGRDNL